ncbi:MAG: hypothetical protein LBM73_01825 [Candidatus Nomurabacteria bacterium]|nr:hypothetical protein [Candidatus Nomurabacteria bacterium]
MIVSESMPSFASTRVNIELIGQIATSSSAITIHLVFRLAPRVDFFILVKLLKY